MTLPVDDIEVLYTIKKRLGVGTVRTQDNYSTSEISKLEDIKLILIPLLENNPLHTTKYLDFLDFK